MKTDAFLPASCLKPVFCLLLPTTVTIPHENEILVQGGVNGVAARRKAFWSHPRDVVPTQTQPAWAAVHPAPLPTMALLPQYQNNPLLFVCLFNPLKSKPPITSYKTSDNRKECLGNHAVSCKSFRATNFATTEGMAGVGV